MTTQDQLAQVAFNLVYIPHMSQAIYQALQVNASLGSCFWITPSGTSEENSVYLEVLRPVTRDGKEDGDYLILDILFPTISEEHGEYLVLEIVLLVPADSEEVCEGLLVKPPMALHNHKHHLGHVRFFFC